MYIILCSYTHTHMYIRMWTWLVKCNYVRTYICSYIVIIQFRLVASVLVYFITGIAIMKFKYQATGSDIIPNKLFWMSLPYLVKVSRAVLIWYGNCWLYTYIHMLYVLDKFMYTYMCKNMYTYLYYAECICSYVCNYVILTIL